VRPNIHLKPTRGGRRPAPLARTSSTWAVPPTARSLRCPLQQTRLRLGDTCRTVQRGLVQCCIVSAEGAAAPFACARCVGLLARCARCAAAPGRPPDRSPAASLCRIARMQQPPLRPCVLLR
jgi:hypothetical protein